MTATERSLPRWLPAIGLLVLLFLGWRVLSLGLADHYAVSDPARALAWRGDHPEALLREAERLAKPPGDATRAGELARRALRANPLDGRPYRVLGQLAHASGDTERAAGLYLAAAARSPRDVPTLAWLVDYHLQRREFAPALARIDLLLRAQPELVPKLQPVLGGLAQFPDAHPALVERLATMPPWRAQVLLPVLREAPEVDALAALMDGLRRTDGGLQTVELNTWVDRLAKEGRSGAAYLIWVSQLPKERLTGLGNLYNGGFEWEPGQGGFDWRLGRIAGARIDRVFDNGATGRMALRVAFQDRRVPFAHVQQILALAPGRYVLAGRVRAQSLRTERGLVWALSCNPSGRPLGQTDPVMGHSPWRSFSLEFEIPAEGCPGQRLLLRLPARIAAEQRIGGSIFFDDMKIARKR